MSLSRLVYFSTNTVVGGVAVAEKLKDILNASVRNNTAAGLTGGLVFNRNHFVQILEGDSAELSKAFARICVDARHEDVVLVEDPKPVRKRLFGAWSMGFAGKTELLDRLARSFCVDGRFDPAQMTADELASFVLELVTKENNFLSSPRYEFAEL